MKKSSILTLCTFILLFCSIICLLIAYPGLNALQAATLNGTSTLKSLSQKQHILANELKMLTNQLDDTQSLITSYKEEFDTKQDEMKQLQSFLISYYIDQLDDPTYVSITPNGYTWYIAAESLGEIGKPAIKPLIERIDTTNDYERAQILYALLLASQADNVKTFAGNDYIHTYLDLNPTSHPQQVKIALAWWKKYQSFFS